MNLATAQTMLDGWLAVELKIMSGQSYSIPEASVTHVDARTVQQRIAYWQRVVNDLTATNSGARVAYSTASFS